MAQQIELQDELKTMFKAHCTKCNCGFSWRKTESEAENDFLMHTLEKKNVDKDHNMRIECQSSM